MGKTISEQRFKELKASIKTHATLALAARRSKVSASTIRRVKNAKNYNEYKQILIFDRGPQYYERKKTSTWNTASKRPVKRTRKGFLGFLRGA